MFYADYNSTTPLLPEVLEKMSPFLSGEFGNPSSVLYPLGLRAREAVEVARQAVAELIATDSENVVFLSGGTESCFQALVGSIMARPEQKQIVTTTVEHQAVLGTVDFLVSSPWNCSVAKLPVERTGAVDLANIESSLRENSGVLSMMLANNETGVVLPVAQACAIAKRYEPVVHCDAIQAAGKVKIDFKSLGVDMLSISAHKFGGPKGIGALIIRKGTKWKPLIVGGRQEEGRRGGTLAVAQIVGFGEAARIAKRHLDSGFELRIKDVRDAFEKRILSLIPEIVINGAGENRLPNTSSVTFKNAQGKRLVEELGRSGIMVSAGSACKTMAVEPSHVLRAMGLSLVDCLSTVRFSFGEMLSSSQLEEFVAIVAAAVETERKLLSAGLGELL